MKSKIWYHCYVVKLFLEGRICSPFTWYGLWVGKFVSMVELGLNVVVVHEGY
jgi:hypothetical protein